MIARGRILILLTRPAVVVLLALFAMTGLAQAGADNDHVVLIKTLVVVVSFLLFSVVLNDLADEAIDRINLAGDRRRPLVAGSGTRTEFIAIAASAGVVAIGTSALVSPLALAVVAGGLALSASYSLRPVRIADRGAVASLLLPAGYVAVPYLVGLFSVRSTVTRSDLVLLGGLYVGFIGRILLKDFRDVRGDALFGKRTFLVRYGRRCTCAVSGACWIAGTLALAGVRGLSLALVGCYMVFVAVALGLLRVLAGDHGARRDEAIISAIAIVGRAMIVTLIGHLSMTDARWSTGPYLAVMGSLVAVMLGQAAVMARRGTATRLTVPEEWVVVSDEWTSSPPRHSTSTTSSTSSALACSTP
jgi:4-hydroxybenzoate polyprenyltransferase